MTTKSASARETNDFQVRFGQAWSRMRRELDPLPLQSLPPNGPFAEPVGRIPSGSIVRLPSDWHLYRVSDTFYGEYDYEPGNDRLHHVLLWRIGAGPSKRVAVEELVIRLFQTRQERRAYRALQRTSRILNRHTTGDLRDDHAFFDYLADRAERFGYLTGAFKPDTREYNTL